MTERKPNPFRDFLRSDAAPGVLLIVVALLAFIWANSPWNAAYEAMKGVTLRVPIDALKLEKPLLLWVNDLLMAVFFLYVGLELKREVLRGELSNPRRAALSIAGAIGGMLVPALLYTVLNSSNPGGSRGWGIPMATDIAFAVGVLSLLGKRVPIALKVFLVALAVVDDMGAVIVIGVFYTANLNITMLLLALGVYAALWALNLARAPWLALYLILGLVMWYFVLKSGLHATIAGVLLATTIPLAVRGNALLENLEHAIAPWVSFLIMPVFALFNAGVPIATAVAGGISLVTLGAFVGLVVGKPLGILGFAWLAVRLRLAELPLGATWNMILGAGFLGGIGFTMALFIASLAFKNDPALEAAKLGVLSASVVAAVVGLLWLRAVTKREFKDPEAATIG
jgi:NhaA family Na+:H+ antiporter